MELIESSSDVKARVKITEIMNYRQQIPKNLFNLANIANFHLEILIYNIKVLWIEKDVTKSNKNEWCGDATKLSKIRSQGKTS